MKSSFPFVALNRICAIALLLGCLLSGGFSCPSQAQEIERPQAVDLLPERTALFVNVNNIPELVSDLKDSNFGKMLQDEQIAPFVRSLYGEAKDNLDELMDNDDFGFSVAELASLPAGEVCFAIVTPRRKEPKFVLIMDIPEDSQVAEDLIELGREAAADDGGIFEESSVADLEFQTVRQGTGDNSVTYVLHQGTFVASNDEEVFSDIITRWVGEPEEKDRTLAGNRKFVTIMNKCKSTEDLPMAVSFFCDPIMLARSAFIENTGARVVFGFLPTLGLDGVGAIGGAALFNEKNYESVFHGHLLLTNPRAGIIQMIALRPGFYEPESFAPEDTATYVTSSWDFQKFVSELEKIVDTFTSEGTFQSQIETFNEELEIDFQSDLLDNLAGRVSFFQWNSETPTLDGQCNCIAIQMKDVDKGQELIETILNRQMEENIREFIIEDEHEGITYWHVSSTFEEMGLRRRDRRRERRRENGESIPDSSDEDLTQLTLNGTQPTMAFIDDYFVLTGNISFMKHMIETAEGEHEQLVDNPEFKETMREIRTLMDGNLPSMLSYARPDLSLKNFYNMLKTDNTRDVLYERAEDNEFFRILSDLMEENELPEFEDLAGYFPAQGSFVINDETGFHFLTFQRKANIDQDDD
ncbi:MAG: hypothetical protein P8J33_12300 [Pirellulaceae bacterium]|nr:hypothetical protein [Pirellulaceae bacterium]